MTVLCVVGKTRMLMSAVCVSEIMRRALVVMVFQIVVRSLTNVLDQAISDS